MYGKSEIEKLIIQEEELEKEQIIDAELQIIDKAVQDFAPEIAFLYHIREDESEEQQIKTGRLHENRILGIILKYYIEGNNKVSTAEVESEYKKYFKEIARSTTSTYLNMLKKEATLYTERDGRIVYYIFYKDPPVGIKPFWFTRIFCIVPAYFHRAMKFSEFYISAEKHILNYINQYGNESKDLLIRNFKFITGLIILKIFKNRSLKCVDCQFSKREIYKKLAEMMHIAIKDRSDVLPNEIVEDIINRYSEIPLFNGGDIEKEPSKENIINEIIRCADIFKKDLEFQLMVSSRRKASRLKQIKTVEENNFL